MRKIVPEYLAVALLLLIFTGCDGGDEEKTVSAYLAEHYSGDFRVVDKTLRGARNWFYIENDERLFQVAASTVPPYHVVEDHFPDLMLSRELESKIAGSLHPIVDLRLDKAAREKIRDGAGVSGQKPDKVELYLSIIGEPSDDAESRIKTEVAKVSSAVPMEMRWQANFYDSSADARAVKYRPVVPLGWMQQSADHYPQSTKINFRYSGTADGKSVVISDRFSIVEARRLNDEANREIDEIMKELKSGQE